MSLPDMNGLTPLVSHAIILVFESDKNLANDVDNVLGLLFQSESPEENMHALLIDPRYNVQEVVDYLRDNGATIPDFWEIN